MPKDGGGHSGYHPSPSLDSLSISLTPPSFPSLGAHESLRPSLCVFHFSTPLFCLQPLVCSLCAPFFMHLLNLLFSVSSLSPSPPRSLLLGKLLCYLITLTVQDGVCVCVSLFERHVQGLGAHPTCYPHGNEQRKKERQMQSQKNKIKYIFFYFFCAWSIAATGAGNVIAPSLNMS